MTSFLGDFIYTIFDDGDWNLIFFCAVFLLADVACLSFWSDLYFLIVGLIKY